MQNADDARAKQFSLIYHEADDYEPDTNLAPYSNQNSEHHHDAHPCTTTSLHSNPNPDSTATVGIGGGHAIFAYNDAEFSIGDLKNILELGFLPYIMSLFLLHASPPPHALFPTPHHLVECLLFLAPLRACPLTSPDDLYLLHFSFPRKQLEYF